MPSNKRSMKPLSGIPKMKKGGGSPSAKAKVMSKIASANKKDKPKGYKG